MPANEGQLKAINLTEGPVLITADPGTGKTYTLVARVVHLVRDLFVAPSEVMVVTKILARDFHGNPADPATCSTCEFCWVCGKVGKAAPKRES